jgi:hypothetical protein
MDVLMSALAVAQAKALPPGPSATPVASAILLAARGIGSADQVERGVG